MLAVRRHPQTPHIPQPQHWNSSIPSASNNLNQINTNQPLFTDVNLTSNIFTFGGDEPLFDYPPAPYHSSPSRLPMQADQSNSWFSHGQLTPTSTTRAHHRESSLSSLGSAGPSSPYTSNTSNPQVAGEIYHDFNDFQQNTSKPLTPIHTPLQENFITPQYQSFYHNSNLAYSMAQESLPKPLGNADLIPAPELISNPSRRTMAVASDSSPPQSSDEQKNGENSNTDFWSNSHLLSPRSGYRQMPKLDRTMTDIYSDELFNPNFQITSAPLSTSIRATPVSPHNDVFSQRLQAANNQHLSASNMQTPLTIPSRERSPFRQGSPLAPTSNSFASQPNNARFGTASHIREQQKAANDARALQQQLERTSPEDTAPKTISPKDVNLVYNEDEEDAKTPLFPQQERRSPIYRQTPRISHEPSEADEVPSLSQQSFGSMATSRRESSSNYSTASNGGQQRSSSYNFATPAVPARQIPQQYPFVPQTHRQTSNISNVSEDFPATLTSMESSGSDFAPESPELLKKPAGSSADTGTYTCTYHGCTLRFDTPAKLQRHKREGHRNSTAMGSGADEGGMTSAAQRNSQAGPHKCERINPSTGKPCNTIFSRPYDLTRHEDTIHNARKQKVHCPICTEEKTFSRNDALTRHLRVVHPEHIELNKSRRRVHD
ncbi:C2H2 and C2HC zinc finger [Glarea lozoyensis ATCC 20868]|uniref:C2H2 and C2HC zinc finger n=1 Tax=Glarea lozoyensis (strain ATCC 20868 / MF5171) TaxID=1116229 RepID=S3DGU8_GLAL2|nr:C2H2 and C2HC zinc finger [Glarea lozoyensis ATCC 20868]EPE25793.1 C2H2 and C2HC zinc finger [Glarea lozoyensis ATCC 20868]